MDPIRIRRIRNSERNLNIHLADLMHRYWIPFSLSKSCETIPLHWTSLIFLMNRHPLTLTVPSSPLFTEAVLIWTIIRTSLQLRSLHNFCLHDIELTAQHYIKKSRTRTNSFLRRQSSLVPISWSLCLHSSLGEQGNNDFENDDILKLLDVFINHHI